MAREPESRNYGGTTDSTAYGGSLAAGPVLRYDLSQEADLLAQGAQYARGEPNGKTLLKEPDLRVVLLTLQSGGRMMEHSASGPSSILVVRGRCQVKAGGSTYDLTAEQLLTIEPELPHEIAAEEDSVILLTIGRTRYRVEETETASRH